MTQVAPAGWYPDPENPTQRRFWDGAAWTQNVASTLPSGDAPQGLASPDSALQRVLDAPVLQAWKTSVGFAVLGLLVGSPLFVAFRGSAPLAGILGFMLVMAYAAIVYPSYFTRRPLLKSNRAISFSNVLFGSWIGIIWNRNLTKKTKGVSYLVVVVASAIACVLLALSAFGPPRPGATSSSTNPGTSSDQVSSVDVGGVSIRVPAPAYFTRLTPDMSELYALQSKFVPDSNQDLGCFISPQDAAAALAGQELSLGRRFSVQVSRSSSSLPVSKNGFIQLTGTFSNDLKKRISDVQDKLTGQLAEASAASSVYSRTEVALRFSDTVPMPAHMDTDRMFAFSALQKYEVKTSAETSTHVRACTSTLLYVNQRVLFLYVWGGKDDLEWTREQSRNWANAILGANPESTIEGVQPLQRTHGASVYKDAATGASFVIPDTWSEQPFSVSQQGRKAKFGVPDPGGTAFYTSGDLWSLIPKDKRYGLTRDDVDNMDDWWEKDAYRLVGGKPTDTTVHRTSLNGVEYFARTAMEANALRVTLARVEDGYVYMFEYVDIGGDIRDEAVHTFYSMVASAVYPEN